jgi:hypothetical protein
MIFTNRFLGGAERCCDVQRVETRSRLAPSSVIEASRRQFAQGPRCETRRRVWRECELSTGTSGTSLEQKKGRKKEISISIPLPDNKSYRARIPLLSSP